MIRKYMLIVIAMALLPMCSDKTSETDQVEPSEKVEPKAVEKAVEKVEPEVVEKVVGQATVPNVEWAKEIDELVKKTADLAALADTKKCVESHDAMVEYMNTHQKRLNELATHFRKMKYTVPPTDKAAFEKKVATDYDAPIKASFDTMAEFAQLCCNKELKQKDALGLEDKLQFIRTLKSGE